MTPLDPNRDPVEADIDLHRLTEVWRANRRLLQVVTAAAVIVVTGVQLWQYASVPLVRRSVQTVRFVLDANQMRDGHVFRVAEVVASGVVERAYASLGQPPEMPVAGLEAQLSIPAVNSVAGEYALVYEAASSRAAPDVTISRLLRAVIEVWQGDRVAERVRRQLPDRWAFAPSAAESSFVRADRMRTQLIDWAERLKSFDARFSSELVAPPVVYEEFRALRGQLESALTQRLMPAMLSECRGGGLTRADADYVKARRVEFAAEIDEQRARVAAARSLIDDLMAGSESGAGSGTRGRGARMDARGPAEEKLLQQAGVDLLSSSYAEARLRREFAVYDAFGCGSPASGRRPVASSLATVVDDLGQLASQLDEKARALAVSATIEGLDYVLGNYTTTERKSESPGEVIAWALLTLILTPPIVFAIVLIRHLRSLPITP